MPNPGPRVESNSIAVTESDHLQLGTDDWRALEAALGKPIPEDAREALTECCRRYLSEKKLELEAVSLRAVSRFLAKLAEEGQPERGAAVVSAEEDALQRIYSHLADVVIEVDRDLDAGRDGAWTVSEQPCTVRLTRRMAAEVIVHLRKAVGKATAELNADLATSSSKAFRPGLALDRFLLALRGWATESGLPHTVHNRSGATAFSRFAFALHSRFPDGLQDRVASAEALHKRMNRLLKGHKPPT